MLIFWLILLFVWSLPEDHNFVNAITWALLTELMKGKPAPQDSGFCMGMCRSQAFRKKLVVRTVAKQFYVKALQKPVGLASCGNMCRV